MTNFKINENDHIECFSANRRSGFAHMAKLYKSGRVVGSTSITYVNRTWESYQYESVLRQLLTKFKLLPKDQIERQLRAWGKDPNTNGMAMFGTLATIMSLGNVLTDTKKESNKWKARMLAAGLPEGALQLPADFDSLPEDEKERRLDKIIDLFKEGVT